jgi:diaminopimelate decarboxylase
LFGSAKKAVKHLAIRRLLKEEERQKSGSPAEHGGLPPQLWSCSHDSNGDLLIDGISARELAGQFGTPLQVVNEKELIRSYRSFLSAFSSVYPNTILATSYKTNPLPHVLGRLHAEGSHAEVISHFELWLALKLGVPPKRIIVNGPGKTDEAIKLAVENRVNIINIDGAWEIDKIARYAREKRVCQRVGVRVITSVGWSSQFGLSIESGQAEEAFRKMSNSRELLPSGLHLHLGTGIQDVGMYVQAVREIVEFSSGLRERYGIHIDHYDFGGGFGVPTVRSMDDWDVRMMSLGYGTRMAIPETVPTPDTFANALSELFEEIRNTASDESDIPQVVFEPGRAITSSCQVLLLRVLGRKTGVESKDNVIVNGGKNIAMPLGWETHKIFAANKMNEKPVRQYDIFGPLCHPGDILEKNRFYPELNENDLLAVMDAGAYFIPNQMNFSNPRPPVVSVSDGVSRLVRDPETFDDVIRLDSL